MYIFDFFYYSKNFLFYNYKNFNIVMLNFIADVIILNNIIIQQKLLLHLTIYTFIF